MYLAARRRPATDNRRCSSGSDMSPRAAAASPAAVAGRTGITASPPVSTRDRNPVQMTGVPVAIASSNASGTPSLTEVMTTAVARR